MILFVIVVLSAALSYLLNFKKYIKINACVEQAALYGVLFSMGVTLGTDATFFEALPHVGASSLLFAVFTSSFCILAALAVRR